MPSSPSIWTAYVRQQTTLPCHPVTREHSLSTPFLRPIYQKTVNIITTHRAACTDEIPRKLIPPSLRPPQEVSPSSTSFQAIKSHYVHTISSLRLRLGCQRISKSLQSNLRANQKRLNIDLLLSMTEIVVGISTSLTVLAAMAWHSVRIFLC